MEDRRPFFVLFGDSITQQGFNPQKHGWAAELADQYQNKVDIINRGFSGYTTRWALQGLLPRVFPLVEGGHHPSLVMVFFGANDSCLPGTFQYVPLDEYKENMKKIIAHLKGTAKAPHVIVIGPPPIDALRWKENRKLAAPDRSMENTLLYAKAAEGAATESQVLYLDLYNTMQMSMLSDGLHFAEEGNRHLAAAVTKLIAEKIPALSPNSIPFAAPYWADIKEDTSKPQSKAH